MGHVGAYALERIAPEQGACESQRRRAEKQAHRRIAGGTGRDEAGLPDALFGCRSRMVRRRSGSRLVT